MSGAVVIKLNDLLLACPGVVGELARSINNSLPFNAPQIALPTSLAFVGALKCERLSCERVEPNLFAISISDTGDGKTTAMHAIHALVNEADIFPLLMGEPASDSGLIGALQNIPRRLLMWDEFGIALEELSQTETGCRALILKTAMQLFSDAGGVSIGKEYSNRSNVQRTDLRAPYFTLLGCSTPDRFFGALSERFVFDGFLPRTLVFRPDEAPKVNYSQTHFDPKPFVSYVETINTWKPGKGGKLAGLRPDKNNFPAPHSLRALKIKYRERRVKLDKLQWAFYSRAWEHIVKIFTVLMEVEDGKTTLQEKADYSQSLVEKLIEAQIEQVRTGLGGKSEKQQVREKFSSCLKVGERVTLRELHLRCRGLDLSPTERYQLIEELKASNVWDVAKYSIDDSPRKTTYITCLESIS